MTASATIALNSRLLDLDAPRVMGIMNVTPDSFYAGSRSEQRDGMERRAAQMAAEGADIIDIGGYSTRPGAAEVTATEEFDRLARGIEAARKVAPEMPISIDTFRAEVASRCIGEFGIEMVNDIGGGTLDPEIWDVVAATKRAYVLMHMRGDIATMHGAHGYERGIVPEVIEDLARKADALHAKGVADVVLDPGFGFSKTLEQNIELLDNLGEVKKIGLPLLVGLSRKSMVYKTLGTAADEEETLWGTLALQTKALMEGADILRVHDVKAAKAIIAVTSRRSGKRYADNDIRYITGKA